MKPCVRGKELAELGLFVRDFYFAFRFPVKISQIANRSERHKSPCPSKAKAREKPKGAQYKAMRVRGGVMSKLSRQTERAQPALGRLRTYKGKNVMTIPQRLKPQRKQGVL
jgi:hypothetical protein